jgi:hypothetical protein
LQPVSITFEDTWAQMSPLGRAEFAAAQNAATVAKLTARVEELEAQLAEFVTPGSVVDAEIVAEP